MSELAQNIKALRQIRGVTRSVLAQQVGVSESYIALLEQNTRKPSMDVLGRLAKALGVEASVLLDRELQDNLKKAAGMGSATDGC